MNNDIPKWITILALDIYRLIQKYDALAYFQEKVREWALGHEAEVNRYLEWRRQRNLHFGQVVISDPRLQDEKSGPPGEGWKWEIYPLNISPQIDSDTKLPIKIVKAWAPPELLRASEPDIKNILPLSREQQLSLTEKYTLLAAIYDSGRKGTDQIPPWVWPDLNTDLSSDELADMKKCLSFESLCDAASSLHQDYEGWLRAFLDDIEKDVSKQEQSAETEPGNKNTKREQEGMIKPKPPEFLQNLLWYIKHGSRNWKLMLIAMIILSSGVDLKFELHNKIFNLFKNKPSTSVDYMRTKLYARTKKRVDDFYESIRNEKLDPWLFINAGTEVRVTKYNGDVINYSGGSFSGSPRIVFWGDDFIPPFIEDAIIEVFDQTIDECRKNGLDPGIYVYEAERILSGFIYNIYNRMADMDKKLLKQVHPENSGRRDVKLEIEKMCKCLDEQYNAALLLASGNENAK